MHPLGNIGLRAPCLEDDVKPLQAGKPSQLRLLAADD